MKFTDYNGKHMEDAGGVMSEESKDFFRAFKAYLKKNLPGCELTGFKPNHYDFSGFVTRPDKKIIFVSYSLDRTPAGCVADFDDFTPMYGVLYRTAENTSDYKGGRNHYTSINDIVKRVLALND